MENLYEQLARWSEILGGIAFLVAAYVLFRRFMLPMVEAAAVARNADLVNAEHRRDQLRADVAAARMQVEEAGREAEAIRERGRHDAQRERERIIAEAHAEGTRLLANARGELERSRLVARDQLRIELIERALTRARAIANERLDDALNGRLIAKTVDELTEGNR
jgi:F-type H+-transporting ATPase subunit b